MSLKKTTKTTLKKAIEERRYMEVIDAIREDNGNKFGNWFYANIPTDNGWDHVFEVLEAFYDLEEATFREKEKVDKLGRKRTYQVGENVRRKIQWQ